ncbi:hypothetical protein Cgig2_008575 [Carnegiea gigantea]|uniref:Uncharacterized protein n=1 Tax=Carnegiea gigantea TaxID=171969 RepID=A0A9Q1JHK5_9CARY|nr:hypothetical protein Cgig2_008575 [Carnegiea gigantea]
MMNKGQEGHVGSGNAERTRSNKPKIRCKKVKEFNNRMSPKGLWQWIENLNDKQKEALALWLVRNFNTYYCSLPLSHGMMKVTERDVHMMLGLPKGPLELCYLHHVVFKLRDFLEDTLDKTIVTNEEEEVNKEERRSKSVEDETKAEDQTGVSKVKSKKGSCGIDAIEKHEFPQFTSPSFSLRVSQEEKRRCPKKLLLLIQSLIFLQQKCKY